MNKEILEINTINLPTHYGKLLMTTYRIQSQTQSNMKYIIVLQTQTLPEIPTIRIQSQCLFSEVFKSLLCDCRDQLDKSLKLISKKQGIVFYLDQEGRGHGLFNKIYEYKLQEEGYDTVEASQKLNLPVDSRRFNVVAKILKLMNIKKVKLITNNPRKIESLGKEGIQVIERVVMPTKVNKYNIKYLKTKKDKLNDLINL